MKFVPVGEICGCSPLGFSGIFYVKAGIAIKE
jgi:hypothetical protein